MICPTCESNLVVVDSVRIPKVEVIRRRKCKECGLIVYTSETMVEYDDVKYRWNGVKYPPRTVR